jgi:hypothetical protein
METRCLSILDRVSPVSERAALFTGTGIAPLPKGAHMIIWVSSLLICLVGVLIYALSANPKLVEIGRIMFFAGLLAFLLSGGAGLGIVHR